MSSRRQYPFHLIEPKWQQHWDAQQTFRAWNPGDAIPAEHPFAQRHGADSMSRENVAGRKAPPKFYILDMFPYPSGAGLHVGHPEGYTATDILARYRRAQGFNVLHPMGWDSFGLPAEQYAVKTGQHPRQTTEANIANFKRQIQSLGFSYDWSRELATTDPDYFKWTQWIFLQLYNSWFNPETNKAEPIETLPIPHDLKFSSSLPAEYLETQRRAYRDSKRLAYVSEAPVNWCPELGTVLANEEVIDGKSEVGGFPVVRKPMRQWLLRITACAEKLLNDLDTIDWSDSLKEMQRNWIGRSEGAEVEFRIQDSEFSITVFTTRPDTLFGATYMVLSPEHKLVGQITPNLWPAETPDSWKGTAQVAEPPKDSQKFGAEPIRLSDLEIPADVISVVTAKLARRYRVIPFANRGGMLSLAMADPSDLDTIDNLQNLLPFKAFEYRIASPDEVEVALKKYYEGGATPATPREAVGFYRAFAASKSDLERTELAKEKTGVFTGAYATNPVNGEKIPIWIADYVLASYGTGAIMAVPGHDSRDLEFARKFDLPVRVVVQAPEGKDSVGFLDDGVAVNSDFLNGLSTPEAKTKITDWLEAEGLGKRTINYKLRDWLFSRQRYWGEPFPIVWKRDASGNLYHEALPESALPLLPPALDDYKPTPDGQPPLARAKDWVALPDGSTRETNTMPQWAGSCWYYLRYLDVKNSQSFVGKEAESYWTGSGSAAANVSSLQSKSQSGLTSAATPGVDLYVGGTEHAVLHLLYARFWHKVLFDLGHVSTPEPFFKLVNQGLILGEDGQKMSKSRGNVVNPDDVLAEFGADAFRLYEMFMGPLEMVKPWNTRGVEGVYRFLGRVWRLFVDEASETEFEQAETTTEARRHGELLKLIKLNDAIKDAEATPAQLKTLHACIKKVTEDLDHLRFNTAISAMMVFVNDAIGWETKPVAVLREFLILLQPFAPHLAEELWSKVQSFESCVGATTQDTRHNTQDSLAYSPWPKFDPARLVESTLEIPVQVNGKLRDCIIVPADASEETIKAAALACEKAKPFLEGKTIKRIIVVTKKMVNIVAV